MCEPQLEIALGLRELYTIDSLSRRGYTRANASQRRDHHLTRIGQRVGLWAAGLSTTVLTRRAVISSLNEPDIAEMLPVRAYAIALLVLREARDKEHYDCFIRLCASNEEVIVTATAEAFFKPERIKPEVRLQNTTNTVKAMLAAETAARMAKTERLRTLRLAQAD